LAAERGAAILDLAARKHAEIIDGNAIDWDTYLKDDEKARVVPAEALAERGKAALLLGALTMAGAGAGCGGGAGDGGEEGDEHDAPRRDHRGRALDGDEAPHAVPCLAVIAIEQVVAGGHESLQAQAHAGVGAVRAGTRQIGRHFAIAGGEIGEFLGAQRVEAL